MTRHLVPIVGMFLVSVVLTTGAIAAESDAADADLVISAEATAVLALDADAAAGKKRYRRECRACHGPTGKGVSSYPKLLERPPEYLVDRLTRYRAGEKFGPNTPLMAPRAKKLSDQNIADLVAFILTLGNS